MLSGDTYFQCGGPGSHLKTFRMSFTDYANTKNLTNNCSQQDSDNNRTGTMDVLQVEEVMDAKDLENVEETQELSNKKKDGGNLSGMTLENNDLSLSGSFCTEVRSLNLVTTSNNNAAETNQDHADPDSNLILDNSGSNPDIGIQSASDDDSDSDHEAPPPKRLQQDALEKSSPASELSSYQTELRNHIVPGDAPMDAREIADLITPEDVAKRLESFQHLKDQDTKSSANLTPLARFRRAATQVRMLCAVQISLDKHIREAGRSAFGGGLPDLAANMANTPSVVFTDSESKERVAFNPSEFKCKYEFTWPKKARHAVSKRPEERTPDDIRLIAGLMRGLHSFRKYSKVSQDLISRVVRLQKYGRRRVVIRKGHVGYSFYFVFSGTACATLDEDEETAFTHKEITLMKKGAAFGEIALLKDVRRMATVICLEDTELLVVDKDEFFDNGLDQHINQEFEFKLDFFKKQKLFSTWPDKHLEEVSDMGRIEDYNHSSVIVKDSTENEWLLFVAKGRCDVLKFVDLAKLCLAEDEDEVSSKNSRRGTRGSSRNPQVSMQSTPLTRDYPLSLLPPGHQSPFPWMAPQRMTTRPKTTGQIASRNKAAIAKLDSHANAKNRSKSATVRLREEPEHIRNSPTPTSIISRGSPSPQPMHRRTCSEPGMPMELKSELSMGTSTIKAPGVQAGAYIKVDSLGPGQCFGLDTAVKGSTPKLSLISQGCEIIRVSMSKFREYADKTTMIKAEDLFLQCPSDYTLWTKFKKQNHWTNFKNGIVTDVLYESQLNNAQNHVGCRAGGGIVSHDVVSTAASRRKAVEVARQKNSSQIAYVHNPFPKISFAASAWADNTASSGRRTTTPAFTSRSLSRSHGSRPASRSSHLIRTVSSAYSVGSRRSGGTRSVSPQRSVHSRLYSMSSCPRVPQLQNITRPTYTGSMAWKQYGKS